MAEYDNRYALKEASRELDSFRSRVLKAAAEDKALRDRLLGSKPTVLDHKTVAGWFDPGKKIQTGDWIRSLDDKKFFGPVKETFGANVSFHISHMGLATGGGGLLELFQCAIDRVERLPTPKFKIGDTARHHTEHEGREITKIEISGAPSSGFYFYAFNDDEGAYEPDLELVVRAAEKTPSPAFKVGDTVYTVTPPKIVGVIQGINGIFLSIRPNNGGNPMKYADCAVRHLPKAKFKVGDRVIRQGSMHHTRKVSKVEFDLQSERHFVICDDGNEFGPEVEFSHAPSSPRSEEVSLVPKPFIVQVRGLVEHEMQTPPEGRSADAWKRWLLALFEVALIEQRLPMQNPLSMFQETITKARKDPSQVPEAETSKPAPRRDRFRRPDLSRFGKRDNEGSWPGPVGKK